MLHVIAGVVMLILGLLGVVSWWADFGAVLRGLIPLLLLIGGLTAMASGLSRRGTANSSKDSE